MRVLITCPPMLRAIDRYRGHLESVGILPVCPSVVQTLAEEALIELVPGCDGWIIGDDPATRAVFEAGRAGRLKAAVKWGVGIDNVDFQACHDLGIPVAHTPGMFGKEVADVAMAYLVALARGLVEIDRAVREGAWIKPQGISLEGTKVALFGFGDVGRNTAIRLLASEMRVHAVDPAFVGGPDGPVPARPGISVDARLKAVLVGTPDEALVDADFIVLTCALTPANRNMIDAAALAKARPGVRVVNVARGPLIDENALAAALESGQVHSAALDVFAVEPLPSLSGLRRFPNCIFGSHNASNTREAVHRTSLEAIRLLSGFLGLRP